MPLKLVATKPRIGTDGALDPPAELLLGAELRPPDADAAPHGAAGFYACDVQKLVLSRVRLVKVLLTYSAGVDNMNFVCL
jgi:hypothetical protein